MNQLLRLMPPDEPASLFSRFLKFLRRRSRFLPVLLVACFGLFSSCKVFYTLQSEATEHGFLESDMIEVVGERWWMLGMAPDDQKVQGIYWPALAILLSGMLITCLLCAYLFLLIYQRERVRRMVNRRTQQLHNAKLYLEYQRNHLQQMVDEQTAEVLTTLEQARQAREEAEYASALKDEFLANMSHELRTPMHAILSLAEIGMKNKFLDNPEKQRQNLHTIHESASRLLLLINNLLKLSRLETGTEEFDFKRHNIRRLVNSVTTQLQGLIYEKNLALDIIENDNAPAVVECDATKITQVIWNLLANAIRYSPEGETITVAYEVCTIDNGEDTQEGLCLLVIDRGVGIPEDELNRIFDKFVQSSITRTGAGGTGLGLSICKEIIETHHGSIWAENNLDQGAIFTFRIPVKQSG